MIKAVVFRINTIWFNWYQHWPQTLFEKTLTLHFMQILQYTICCFHGRSVNSSNWSRPLDKWPGCSWGEPIELHLSVSLYLSVLYCFLYPFYQPLRMQSLSQVKFHYRGCSVCVSTHMHLQLSPYSSELYLYFNYGGCVRLTELKAELNTTNLQTEVVRAVFMAASWLHSNTTLAKSPSHPFSPSLRVFCVYTRAQT